MRILIVDDSDIKIDKIKSVIKEIRNCPDDKILVYDNNSDAVFSLLQSEPVDLLILDLNLPLRKGANVKKMAGLNIINEINRRFDICKPECIIGLTAFEKIKEETKAFFEKEGWAIVTFNLKNSDWEETIRNKLIYLINKKNTLNIKSMPKEKILFIASSPTDQSLLNAGMEQRKIDEVLNASSMREKFELISKPGAKLDILTRELLQQNPQYLHFTGHGDNGGLAFEDENGSTVYVPSTALQDLFSLFKGIIKCVILSACYSSAQAKIISEQGLFVIGMNDSVGVAASTEFAKGFYQALAEGRDVPTAFKFGLVHLTTNDTSQKSIPVLWNNGGKVL